MNSQSEISHLSTAIANNVGLIDAHVNENSLPSPSFALGALPLHLEADDIQRARTDAIQDALKLIALLLGPQGFLLNKAQCNASENLALKGVYQFRLVHLFDLNEVVSYEELAKRSGVPIMHLKRIVWRAMDLYVFEEDRSGNIKHTALSETMRKAPLVESMIGIMGSETWPATSRFVEAVEKHGVFTDPVQAGWALANGTNESLYDYMPHDPVRGERFASAMGGYASMTDYNALARQFDWESINKQGGTIVDVGGGWGPVSIELANRFPNIKFVIQDLAHVVEEGKRRLPEDLSSRFTFQPANFFEPQTVKGAHVYFMRAIMSNWPDAKCSVILRQLVDALGPNSHVLINNGVSSGVYGSSSLSNQQARAMDLTLASLFGSRNRSKEEWQDIFRAAHPDLKLVEVRQEPGAMAILVLRLVDR